MGFSLAVVRVSWNRRYLSGFLMNRKGEKFAQPSRTLLWWGEGVGRGLYIALHPLCSTWPSFEGSELFDRSLPAPSWCCLWGFCLFLVQFCARTTRHQLKDLQRFFFSLLSSCFPGSLSTHGGFPGSMEREAQLGESPPSPTTPCRFLRPAISEVRAGNEEAGRSGVPGQC